MEERAAWLVLRLVSNKKKPKKRELLTKNPINNVKSKGRVEERAAWLVLKLVSNKEKPGRDDYSPSSNLINKKNNSRLIR